MAAEEAEAVTAVECSSHGRAYLDGLFVNGKAVCECNSCFGGPDCSQFFPGCVADSVALSFFFVLLYLNIYF